MELCVGLETDGFLLTAVAEGDLKVMFKRPSTETEYNVTPNKQTTVGGIYSESLWLNKRVYLIKTDMAFHVDFNMHENQGWALGRFTNSYQMFISFCAITFLVV